MNILALGNDCSTLLGVPRYLRASAKPKSPAQRMDIYGAVHRDGVSSGTDGRYQQLCTAASGSNLARTWRWRFLCDRHVRALLRVRAGACAAGCSPDCGVSNPICGTGCGQRHSDHVAPVGSSDCDCAGGSSGRSPLGQQYRRSFTLSSLQSVLLAPSLWDSMQPRSATRCLRPS